MCAVPGNQCKFRPAPYGNCTVHRLVSADDEGCATMDVRDVLILAP